MIIENQEALKGWLTHCLGPMCDADPAALAKYVMALVKKDKPEKELKDICLDQLEVFLQKGTQPFVDLLFETLSTKAYLKHGSSTSTTSSTPTLTSSIPVITTSGETIQSLNSAPIVTVPKATSLSVASSPQNSAGTQIKQENRRVKTEPGGEDERDARRPSRRSRSRSRSRSPISRGGLSGRSRSRDVDDRRNRRLSEDERRKRPVGARRYDNRHRDFRDRRLPDMNERDRERERDRDRDRERESRLGRERERAPRDRIPLERSRSRSRSRSWSRAGSRSGSWSRSKSRSLSRSRSRSRGRSRDRTRQEPREARNRGDTPQMPTTSDHGDMDYRTGSLSSTVNSIVTTSAPSTNLPATAQPAVKGAKRCRDYDEKGYCMRGDLCPYDHGADPVVVDDIGMLGFPPGAPPPATQPPPPGPPTTNMHHVMPTVMGQPSHSGPPLPHGPPPPPPPLPPPPPPPPPQPDQYAPEPYNPEAPGMERPPRLHPNFWPPRPGPRGPPPMFHPGPPQRTRELIGVPTVDDSNAVGNRTVVEPQRSSLAPPINQAVAETPKIETVVVPSAMPQNDIPGKRRFDYNRLGARRIMAHNSERSTLELRKVPRHLNTITQLNNHFSKFGTIVNLQVCYEGDPEAALIQFLNHAEANAAYRSTEAVLNNRFIKVFWHNKDNSGINSTQSTAAAPTNRALPLPTSQTVPPPLHQQQSSVPAPTPSAQSQNGSGPSAMITSKISIKERLGLPPNVLKPNNTSATVGSIATSTAMADAPEKAAVVFSSGGNLSRTVFNPSALKKTNVLSTPSTPTTKKGKEDQKKNAIKRKLELQKKRQDLLENYMQQQKILVTKLESCKKEKERSEIKQTIDFLVKSIKQLEEDMRKDAEVMASKANSGPKSKTEAEKELLDAEMDLYNKQHRGDDTTELRKKVLDLRQQAKALGLISGGKMIRGIIRRGLLRSRIRGSIHNRSLTSVDRRPRKVAVACPQDVDKDVVAAYFAQLPEVENVEQSSTGLIIGFKTRKDAEMAFTHGTKFKDKVLKLTWHKDPVASEGELNADDAALEEELQGDDEHLDVAEDLFLGDDEEEEDSEARSWRR